MVHHGPSWFIMVHYGSSSLSHWRVCFRYFRTYPEHIQNILQLPSSPQFFIASANRLFSRSTNICGCKFIQKASNSQTYRPSPQTIVQRDLLVPSSNSWISAVLVWSGKKRSHRTITSYFCCDINFQPILELYWKHSSLVLLSGFSHAFPVSTGTVSPGYSQSGGCPHPRGRPAVPHRLALQFQPCALQGCWTSGRLGRWGHKIQFQDVPMTSVDGKVM